MILKRGSVLGVFLLSLILSGPAQAQAQSQGVPGRLAALEAQVDQALATIARLQAALATEAAARQASDAALAASIGGQQGGGVTPAQLQQAMGTQSSAWTTRLNEALAPLMTLAPLATYVSVNTGTINDLAGPHVIFRGVNVHIQNGDRTRDSLTPNGLGNLVVGYNESAGYSEAERGGSHNVVVGAGHRYNFGSGFVAGYVNRLVGPAASVSGGGANEAAGFATVSGGSNNRAAGPYSSVVGGDSNSAIGGNSVVSAGGGNQATGDLSAVSGGSSNIASGVFSTVGGGANLTNGMSFTFIP